MPYDSLISKPCKGCSHPTICRTHGCAVIEAARNAVPATCKVCLRSLTRCNEKMCPGKFKQRNDPMTAVTLNLDDRYTKALEDLCAEQDMTKTALLKASLRLYQVVHNRAKVGEQLAFTKDGKVVPLIVVGLGILE